MLYSTIGKIEVKLYTAFLRCRRKGFYDSNEKDNCRYGGAYNAFSMGNVSASAAAKVAALMYHSVTTDSSRWNDYTISPEQLDADIQYFKSCGYIPMTATELATANMADIDNRKILLLTFDDGYSNFYTEVFPVLKKMTQRLQCF